MINSYLQLQPGMVCKGVVLRDLVRGDVRQSLDAAGLPDTYRNGNPKFEMLLPLVMQCHQDRLELHDRVTTLVVSELLRYDLWDALDEAKVPIDRPPQVGDQLRFYASAGRTHVTGYKLATEETKALAKQYQHLQPPPAPLADTYVVESEAERLYLESWLALAPDPLRAELVTQHKVPSYRLDFAIPRLKIGIEIDGYEWHSKPDNFHNDRVRWRALQRQGWRLIIFSGREACKTPMLCVNDTVALVKLWSPEDSS